MKRLAIAFFLLLFGSAAIAGWNIKQKDDGGAVWIDGNGKETPVGGGGVVSVNISDLSSANTTHVLSQKAGVISKAWLVLNTAGTAADANPVLTFFLVGLTSNDNLLGQTVTVSSGATLTAATGTAGAVGSTSFTAGTRLTEGRVIAVVPSTTTTSNVDGKVYILIE